MKLPQSRVCPGLTGEHFPQPLPARLAVFRCGQQSVPLPQPLRRAVALAHPPRTVAARHRQQFRSPRQFVRQQFPKSWRCRVHFSGSTFFTTNDSFPRSSIMSDSGCVSLAASRSGGDFFVPAMQIDWHRSARGSLGNWKKKARDEGETEVRSRMAEPGEDHCGGFAADAPVYRIRQMLFEPSSVTISEPCLSTVTPTGRPQTSPESVTKPVMKSSYSPLDFPP